MIYILTGRTSYAEYVNSILTGGSYEKRAGNTFITDGFPEAGGGGASATTEAAPGAEGGSGGDDDDGGDADPEPRRSRSSARPSATSGKRRDATATAGALAHPPKDSSIELWRLPTVLQHVPISRSGWWAGVKAGRYPAPVRLSTRCVAWRSTDIRSLIASL
ncbi:helix-turn-helix transcriptional regulator [Roseateles sp.]|jgi:prophage regulatory protein|uniref:helix-turn-helix transcriptional regulator n=1 Tax=Roseateles sp. TaxID=1971397 RepID=UPI0037C5417A